MPTCRWCESVDVAREGEYCGPVCEDRMAEAEAEAAYRRHLDGEDGHSPRVMAAVEADQARRHRRRP